jgi:pyruvate formate lyase activating enzyme
MEKETLFYEKLSDKKVRCNICAHRCIIAESKMGVCNARENRDGKLYVLNYGKIIARHVDPIEKKPLFHFYPASPAYSVATVGCNFKCSHCQNFEISQMPTYENRNIVDDVKPQEIVDQAIKHNCKSIAYTYTEPTVFYDYAFDTARLAHEKNIKNIFVTNGYMTSEALKSIAPYLDAANVDIKSFSNDFYKKICKAELQPVLETVKLLKQLGIWVEVTTLVIPTLNDSEQELQQIADFIVSVGSEIPWHISAFYPAYQLLYLPPTPPETLHKAREIGIKAGLRYVFTGNIGDTESETTYCYNCGKALIRRRNYTIMENCISDSSCPSCGTAIDGVGLAG